MDMGEAVIVAGIGCRKGVTAAQVLAAVQACTASVPSSSRRREAEVLTLDALATAAFKAREPGILAAAEALGLALIAVSDDDLKRASARCLTRSPASLAVTGIASVAEAAALAAAGKESRLLGPRIAAGNVTSAIAQGGEEI